MCLDTPSITYTGKGYDLEPYHMLYPSASSCLNEAFICGWESAADCTIVLDYGCNVRIKSVTIVNANFLNGVSLLLKIIILM